MDAALEAERLQTLRSLRLLDTPPHASWDRLAALASAFYRTPISLISLVDKDRQWFKARMGLEIEETPRDYSFCAHAINGDRLMVVEDAWQDPRFRDNPLVTDDPGIRFYAGAPVAAADGQRVGTLCVIDREPRSAASLDGRMLRLLADQVEDLLALHQGTLELQDAMAAIVGGSKSEAINQVAHEIYTPLTPIVMQMAALRDDVAGNDRARKRIDMMARNIDRIREAVKNAIIAMHGTEPRTRPARRPRPRHR